MKTTLYNQTMESGYNLGYNLVVRGNYFCAYLEGSGRKRSLNFFLHKSIHKSREFITIDFCSTQIMFMI